jgi:NDP-sugar pyrophosphorylase family protein
MRYLKRLLVLAVISSVLLGCAYKRQFILLPVEKYHFITKAGDVLQRQTQDDQVSLPVDGVWISIGEKEKYEHAQEYAVEHGYVPQ